MLVVQLVAVTLGAILRARCTFVGNSPCSCSKALVLVLEEGGGYTLRGSALTLLLVETEPITLYSNRMARRLD